MATLQPFAHHRFAGSHREVGRQHGEALRALIARHLDLVLARGLRKSGLSREQALDLAGRFVPFVAQYSPGLWEEIEGLAEGAGIAVHEAMLLQVKQEVIHLARFAAADQECTTFAVAAPYTRTGYTYAGQNADLSGPMEDLSVVAALEVTGKPRVLMLLPAGQVSYIGMNEAGLSACGNFLHCSGWRRGYPRYLLTRLALEQTDLEAAVTAAVTPPRASARNLMFASQTGGMVDIENTVTEHALLRGEGYLVHANHYLAPALMPHELSQEHENANSAARGNRMTDLVRSHAGQIDHMTLQTFCRDHQCDPDSLCAHRQPPVDTHTFASMICRLSEGKMDLARGPVCENEYYTYSL